MDDQSKPDLRISYLEHRSMRALAAWYARYEAAIHDHHHAEARGWSKAGQPAAPFSSRIGRHTLACDQHRQVTTRGR
jgi:hypothetical protein